MRKIRGGRGARRAARLLYNAPYAKQAREPRRRRLVTTARDETPLVAPRAAARRAGAALILTAVASALGILARMVADADRPAFAEYLDAVSASGGLYAVFGVCVLASGVALFVSARALARTRFVWDGNGSPLSPALFAVSGVFTAVSGACAMMVAALPPDVSAAVEIAAYLRQLTGVIGFSTSGLALLVAARRQWKAGGALIYAALASAAVGLAMQSIWLESAQIAHRLGGAAFLLWMAACGAALWVGRAR